MIQTVRLRSDWGMIEVDLLQCNYCGKSSQEKFSVGWMKVEKIGISVSTMSNAHLDTQHFCGIDCLRKGAQ